MLRAHQISKGLAGSTSQNRHIQFKVNKVKVQFLVLAHLYRYHSAARQEPGSPFVKWCARNTWPESFLYGRIENFIWFSNTANVNRKTVDSSGIWTQIRLLKSTVFLFTFFFLHVSLRTILKLNEIETQNWTEHFVASVIRKIVTTCCLRLCARFVYYNTVQRYKRINLGNHSFNWAMLRN